MEPDNPYDPDTGWKGSVSSIDLSDYTSIVGVLGPNNTSAVPNSMWGTSINNHTVINGPIHSGEMTVSDGAGGWIKVGEALRRIMDRLAILEPDLEKMERYPALKAAYDNYKIMEALLNEEAAGKK